MKTSKVLMIVGGVVLTFILLIGLLFFSIWRMTSGPADAATAFFTTIARSGPLAAYQSTSIGFQQATPFDTFTTIVNRGGLAKFSSATWNNRQINNGNAHVEGTITIDNGSSISLPAKLDLVRGSGGQWQVLNFDITMPGVSGLPGAANDNGVGQSGIGAAPPPVATSQGVGAN